MQCVVDYRLYIMDGMVHLVDLSKEVHEKDVHRLWRSERHFVATPQLTPAIR